MLTRRIIPCLDIKDGRTVKGVNFEGIRDAGDPVELAKRYADQGADELVFLDISASSEKRKTLSGLVLRIAREINIPFTVGGGVSEETDVEILLSAGADKISINSSAVKDPDLIRRLSGRFGSQCIVLAIDTKEVEGRWKVFVNGGRTETELEALAWATKGAGLGAGEILLTSIGNDGTRQGFANDVTSMISGAVKIPVIASGGGGTMQHFADSFLLGKADAALAASVFHYDEIGIPALKKYLEQQNIPIRR